MVIAQDGVTYAQVVSGRVWWLFTGENLPVWADIQDVPAPVIGINAVPATQGVAIGWLYDGVTFSPPA